MNRLLTFSYNHFYGYSKTDGIGGAMVVCLECSDQIGCATNPMEMIHKWRNFYCNECRKEFAKDQKRYKISIQRLKDTFENNRRHLNPEALWHYQAFRSAILERTKELRKKARQDISLKDGSRYMIRILLLHILSMRAELFRVMHPNEGNSLIKLNNE